MAFKMERETITSH